MLGTTYWLRLHSSPVASSPSPNRRALCFVGKGTVSVAAKQIRLVLSASSLFISLASRPFSRLFSHSEPVESGHLCPLSVLAPQFPVKCNRSKRRLSNAHVPAQRVGAAAPRPAAGGALALHLTPSSRGRLARTRKPPLTSNVRCGVRRQMIGTT
jgi:hypothetical protein